MSSTYVVRATSPALVECGGVVPDVSSGWISVAALTSGSLRRVAAPGGQSVRALARPCGPCEVGTADRWGRRPLLTKQCSTVASR
ncbi:hypothetical protein GCM10025875_05330 [Litorihabitans aurantiacus]|uniref:Uncharacterized protein n=1 Tax=Litorihabitans aurantiacus TaxID=1930061 RepID=A0AA37XCS6_9MICO|nr:hypothetical protein GCM10025875_05330 [Litorihabitans aurantiacus]